MLTISLKKPGLPYALIGFVIAYVAIFSWFLPHFLSWDLNLYAALMLAPYICDIRLKKFSLRYFLPTLLALILVVFIPVRTLFFIALLFSVLLLIENSLGKLSNALLFLLFLVSPVFMYLIRIVDFPIRLWLTQQVATLLSEIGISAVATGNHIEMEKYDFAVDPACAGLNMLVISLIMCLFILIYFQKRTGKHLSLIRIIGLFAFTITLNIISNFFRILILVMFKIMPGTFFHDFIGIACLLLYVIMPLILGMKPLLSFFGKTKEFPASEIEYPGYPIRFPMLHGIILVLLLVIGCNLVSADTLSSVNHQIQLKGYQKQRLENGILKFENNEALVYIKPSPFYVPGHDPKLCWVGSGYTFEHIKTEKIAGITVYTALLTKGSDLIYAAWWFDDGKTSTVDQILWRWESAKESRQFYLVNVNAMSSKSLRKQVAMLLENSNYLIAGK